MQIRWTKNAKKNLDKIEDYISQDNPRAAIETVLKIIKTVEVLSDHPYAGKAGRLHNTREFVISDSSFFIVYRIRKDYLEILRVLHGAVRWPK